MSDPASYVGNSHLLTRVLGEWPSFHDAEVVAMDLWRGDICPERNSWIGPVLTAKIQVKALTQSGGQQPSGDLLVTLRFHDVDGLHLLGFNHQNAIIALSLWREEPEGCPALVRVRFEPALGIEGSFRCARVEVIGVDPFAESGFQA